MKKRIDFENLSAYLQAGTNPESYFVHRNEPGELKTPFAFVHPASNEIHIAKRDLTLQEFFALHHLVSLIVSQPQPPTT